MTFRPLYAAAATVVLFFAVIGVATTWNAYQPPTETTVMPCSAWATDPDPVIPANTLTDACVDPSGTLHTAPTAAHP